MTETPEQLKAKADAAAKAKADAAAKEKADADLKAKAEEASAKAKLEEEKQKRKDLAEDPLYAETDQRLKQKLGEDVYKDFQDHPLKERVMLLIAVEKAVDKQAAAQVPPATPPIDKTGTPNGITNPPAGDVPEAPKTLLELNNAEDFKRDFRAASSYLEKSKRMRTRAPEASPNPAVGAPPKPARKR